MGWLTITAVPGPPLGCDSGGELCVWKLRQTSRCQCLGCDFQEKQKKKRTTKVQKSCNGRRCPTFQQATSWKQRHHLNGSWRMERVKAVWKKAGGRAQEECGAVATRRWRRQWQKSILSFFFSPLFFSSVFLFFGFRPIKSGSGGSGEPVGPVGQTAVSTFQSGRKNRQEKKKMTTIRRPALCGATAAR